MKAGLAKELRKDLELHQNTLLPSEFLHQICVR